MLNALPFLPSLAQIEILPADRIRFSLPDFLLLQLFPEQRSATMRVWPSMQGKLSTRPHFIRHPLNTSPDFSLGMGEFSAKGLWSKSSVRRETSL